jgi:toxin ParE1/3/4
MPDPKRPAVWSPEAQADLEEIWTYYAGVAGRQTADNMVRHIANACDVIEAHPLGGRARDELRLGLRSMTVRPHIIFYRLSGDVPEIVRVLDGRRVLDEIFADDGTG